jgi:hypothetical protein
VTGPEDEFPPPRYACRYEEGFHTDRERIEPSGRVWDFLFSAAEKFIRHDPHVASHPFGDMGGLRFLLTEPAGLLDVPPLIVYFTVNEAERRIAFLSVERVDDVVGGPDA